MLTQVDYQTLADFNGPHCVSLYIDTGRVGEEEKSRIRGKNALQTARERLEEQYGLREEQANTFLQPAFDLFSQPSFWQDQSDCLAVFIGDGHFSYYHCPIVPPENVFVGDQFYVRHLLPLINGPEKQFYLLTLSQDDIDLYQANEYEITSIAIEDLVPDDMQAALRIRNIPRGLSRAGAPGTGGGPNAVMFSRSADNDQHKEELKVYFDRVNDGISQILDCETAPLILAGAEELIPVFQEANTYNHLYTDGFVAGNVDRDDMGLLHEKAWHVIGDHFDAKAVEDQKSFDERLAAKDASAEVAEVYPAAISGRIETLWVNRNTHVYGKYTEESHTVDLAPEATTADATELLEAAARAVHAAGGRVYNVSALDMPAKGADICGVYRY